MRCFVLLFKEFVTLKTDVGRRREIVFRSIKVNRGIKEVSELTNTAPVSWTPSVEVKIEAEPTIN